MKHFRECLFWEPTFECKKLLLTEIVWAFKRKQARTKRHDWWTFFLTAATSLGHACHETSWILGWVTGHSFSNHRQASVHSNCTWLASLIELLNGVPGERTLDGKMFEFPTTLARPCNNQLLLWSHWDGLLNAEAKLQKAILVTTHPRWTRTLKRCMLNITDDPGCSQLK